MNSLGDRELKTVSFNIVDKGLGFFLIGGEEKKDEYDIPGIFIKSISPGGLASIDGRLKKGDQIASVNGENFLHISKEKAIEVLTVASEDGFVQLKILRDGKSRQDFSDLCDLYAFSRTSTPLVPYTPQRVNSNADSRDGTEWNRRSGKDSVTGEMNGRRMNGRRMSDAELNEAFSIDPNVRLKVQRLKQSLGFLGFQLSGGEEASLRQALDIDENGTVAYGEFVKKVKEMFVEDSKINYNEDKGTMLSDRDPYEYQQLKAELAEKEASTQAVDRELSRYKNENHDLKQELDLLRNKVSLAEEFKRAAVQSQKDYEVVIARLEEKNQEVAKDEGMATTAGSHFEFRRAEVAKQIHQNATNKLLSFARFVVETFSQRKEKKQAYEAQMPSSASSAPPLDFSASDDVIVREAQRTLRAVQLLLRLDEDIPETDVKSVKLSLGRPRQTTTLASRPHSKSTLNLYQGTYEDGGGGGRDLYRGDRYSSDTGNYRSNLATGDARDRVPYKMSNSPSHSILKRAKNRDSLLSLPTHFT